MVNKFLYSVFRNPYFPYIFQIIGLFFYLGLIWFSAGVVPPPSESSKFFAQNNLVTLIVWGIWLPLLIISTVFFGRIWCTVCPLELVNNFGERIGKYLGIKKISLPPILNNGIISVILYSFLLFMVIATRFPRVPGNVAILLSTLLLLAFVTGIILRDRVFCKVLCPAAMLLRAYGRRGIFTIRRKEPQICSTCNDNSCVAEDKRYNLNARSCPNLLDPRVLKDSSNCNLCGQCIKACSNINIIPRLRKIPALPNDNWKDYGFAITIFAFFLSGFVIEEMFHEWHSGEFYYSYIPMMVKKAIGIKALSGWINGIWSMVVIPFVLWITIGVAGKLLYHSVSVWEIWKKITLPLITLLIGAQLIRAFTKFSHWVTHLPSAFNGFKERIIANPIPDLSLNFTLPEMSEGLFHKHLFPNSVILIYSVIILAVFSYFALKEVQKTTSKSMGYMSIIFAIAIINFVIHVVTRVQ